MKFNWLTQKGDAVYFTGHKMEIYIPKYYFEKNMARFLGSKIETLGLFEFIVIHEDGKTETHVQKLPMNCIFEFEDYRSENYESKNGEIIPSNVFVLETNMLFLDSVKKEQSAANSKNFVFALHGGKIPSTVEYSDLINIYLENLILNGTKIGNPGCILEMTIAELARSKDDQSVPFRKIIGRDNKVSQTDYQLTNIKNLPPINSTFTALAFENMDASIISSISKAVNGEEERISPVEKTIKY